MAIAIALAFAASLALSSNHIFVRLGTQRISGSAAALIAAGVGSIIAMPLALAFDLGEMKNLPLIVIPWFLLLGAVHHPVGRVLSFTSISMIGPIRSAPIINLSPVFTIALAMLVLGERPGVPVILGTLVVVGGGVMMLLGGRRGQSDPEAPAINNLGYLLAAGTAVALASVHIIARHIVTDFAPPLTTAAFGLTIGFLMLGGLTHREVGPSLRVPQRRYIVYCALAGICSTSGVLAVFLAYDRAPVTVVIPVFAGGRPLVTLILAHFFLQRLEQIDLFISLGTLLTIAGLGLVILGIT